MYTNLKKFRCGGCGHDKYNIYQEDTQPITRIITECDECKSQSEITITPSNIQIKWGESGDGIMCVFQNDN